MTLKGTKCCTACGSTKGKLNKRGEHTIFVKGLCGKCYTRLYKHGDVNTVKHVMGEHRSSTPEYHIWSAMRNRCCNPNDKRYSSYGGRGIKLCDRWMNYSNFINDMGKRPSEEYSIDRIDNDGDYCPENCRWTSKYVQAGNKRNNAKVPGVTYAKKDDAWLVRLMRNGKLIFCKQVKDYEEAVRLRKNAEVSLLGSEVIK